jgi:osmotically-inducible protein OsmY
MSANSNADGKLVQLVNGKLSMRGFRAPCNITVTSSRSEITLTGTVPQSHQKISAAQIAQGISGVKRVNNQLVVKAVERQK